VTKPKHTDARIEVVLTALRSGNTRRAAAAYAQIDHATFYRWIDADATFRDAVEKAEADAEARAVAIVVKAAQMGTWQAAAWWLERRRRNEFALQQKVELSGPQGGPIETRNVTSGMDDHEREALRNLLTEAIAQEADA
jgi:transposase